MYRQKVDDLVNELLTIDNTPISQQTFSNDVLIQYMDDSLQDTIVPLITSAREEYFVTTYSYAINPSSNNGLTTIAIPGESAGFRVRDLYMYNSLNGNTNFNWDFTAKCKRINPDTIPYNLNALFMPYLYPGNLPQYFIENNQLIFYPTLTQSWIAKLRVFKKPNHLISYNKCAGQILSLNGNNTVTVDNVPQGTNILPNGYGDWTQYTGVNATTVDVLQPNIPFNFRTSASTGFVLINKSILGVSGTDVTLDADTYASVQVGDFLVTNESSPFLQYVPFEAYNLVKLLASMRVLKAQGDLANWSVSAQMYNQAAHDFLNLITPKVENQPKKIGGGGSSWGGWRSGW